MNFLCEESPVPGMQGTTEVLASVYLTRKLSVLIFAVFILRFDTYLECICRGLDSLQPQPNVRRLIKVIKCKFWVYIVTFILTNQGSTSCLCLMHIALFVCQIAVEIRMFSTNKTFCKHYDADSDNVMSTVNRGLLGTKLVSGTTVGDVIIEMAKGVSLAREKPHKKGSRLPSRH